MTEVFPDTPLEHVHTTRHSSGMIKERSAPKPYTTALLTVLKQVQRYTIRIHGKDTATTALILRPRTVLR